ncbi:hypothetical protein L6164_003336 [Bauhinia variegata]|uniref:Uncharacterized protein n=1 Tax=Bauhinia variegata TaxID=167791 RepID=A0ACB9Q0E3_BAUVA|nr:hypothetical protein L6164_003336 [Bauhinia variegata]
MGKHVQYTDSDSYWESAGADCSYFILHIIKSKSWFNLKKRIKQKTRSSNRRSVSRKDGSSYPGKPVSSSAEKSLGSQIKALINKEVYRRKSKHHRSSTCPPNVLPHDLEASNIDSSAETVRTNGSMMVIPESSPRKKMSLGDYLYDFIQENMKDKRQDTVENKLINAEKPVTDASANVYKDFLGSVDTINLNQDLISTVVQDPEFPLAKGGETPCIVQEGTVLSVAEYRSGGISDQNPTIVKHVTGESRKEKHCIVMDAILHKVPQGHRISDELKDKILRKLTYPIRPKEDKDSHASGYESDFYAHSLNKHHQRTSSLTSLDRYSQLYEISFNRNAKHPQSERLNLRTEGEHTPLRTRKSLGRISSLPDLQSYSNSFHNEEFSNCSSPAMSSGYSTMSLRSSAYAQQGSEVDINAESPLQLDTPINNMMQENFNKVGEDDSVIGNNLEPGSDSNDEINTIIADDIGPTTSKNGAAFVEKDVGQIERFKDAAAASDGDLTTKDSKSKPGLFDRLEDVVEQKEDILVPTKMTETIENFQNIESLRKHLKHEISHFHLDTKDKAKFNYMRDLLEQSRFIGNEFLQAWHSDDLPLDQSVYKEMECDPQQGCDFDHQFLFDLTNEVLMEIYGKSCGYCPLRLSSVSHSRPMWVERHVLHEVWTHINRYLNSKSKLDQSIDEAVSLDLAKADEWVNPQFNMECMALEIEESILHDLLEEILYA